MPFIKFASDYGFSPSNDGALNHSILQKLLDDGGEIVIDKPGTYEIKGTLDICSDTTLSFVSGTYVKRIPDEKGNEPFIINKGAYTRTYDSNIQIKGLKLICNGVNVDGNVITGINGEISFFYTKHTLISDFQCFDVPNSTFCIQICTFEDSVIENVHIEGLKDAVHYGPGKRFILRNGVFRTFDDPIALNSQDYTRANPQLGWIEDGLIEYCYDLNQDETTGYFCRLLAGAWCDWSEGMIIRNSDTVVSNGRLYRANTGYDGKEHISLTKPEFEKGTEILDDIKWVMVQDDNCIYNSGCRNITFKDIHLEKNRPSAFCFHFDNDIHSHSHYPYAKSPVQTNITFENIYITSNVKFFIYATTPCGLIKIKNANFKNTAMRFSHRGVEGIQYNPVDLFISDTDFSGECKIQAVEGRMVRLHENSNYVEVGSSLSLEGNVVKI